MDRDLLWTIQDWRLEPDAQIAPGFNNRMEEAMDGRVGNTVTINGRLPRTLHVRAGERIRLRLLNAAIARIMALRFEGTGRSSSPWTASHATRMRRRTAASCSAPRCAPT